MKGGRGGGGTVIIIVNLIFMFIVAGKSLRDSRLPIRAKGF
jgi:hypothetical protein